MELVFYALKNIWKVKWTDAKGKAQEQDFPNSIHARKDAETFMENIKNPAAKTA